jgi:hypothetical protein
VGTLTVEPLRILDSRVRQLRNRLVDKLRSNGTSIVQDLLLGKTLRHYDETIPHFFDHLENMFLKGWVYVTPPFDLDSQDYLRPTLLFSIHSETIK